MLGRSKSVSHNRKNTGTSESKELKSQVTNIEADFLDLVQSNDQNDLKFIVFVEPFTNKNRKIMFNWFRGDQTGDDVIQFFGYIKQNKSHFIWEENEAKEKNFRYNTPLRDQIKSQRAILILKGKHD